MPDLRRRLQSDLAGVLGSEIEARWIVEEVLGPRGRDRLEPAPGEVERQTAEVRALCDRRRSGIPLQYVLGHWSFRALDLLVDPRVLIPRPETEEVVEVALAELARVAGPRDDPVVADLGTGTGAVALSFASEARGAHPRLQVWATDVDSRALAVASANRDRLGAADPGVAERVVLRRGDWFGALPQELRGGIDLVVSNPPYVAAGEWDRLQAEVRHEPFGALVAAAGSDGTPGLAAVEAVLRGAIGWLARPGAVVVELAPHQASAARDLARAVGYVDVAVRSDLTGRDRAVVCRV